MTYVPVKSQNHIEKFMKQPIYIAPIITNIYYKLAVIFCIGFICLQKQSLAQYSSFEKDWKFAKYLITSNNIKQATAYIPSLSRYYMLSSSQTDSIINLELQLGILAPELALPPRQKTEYVSNLILQGYLEMRNMNYANADSTLQFILKSGTQATETEVILYYNQLLWKGEENLKLHDSIVFKNPVNQIYTSLKPVVLEIQEYHSRKPLVAATLSLLIPGAGKFYIHRKGEAMAAILMNAMLGTVVWENYRKSGPQSALFIGSSAIFSVFYLGNIYGSYYAVKRDKDIRYKEWNEKISFELNTLLEPHKLR